MAIIIMMAVLASGSALVGLMGRVPYIGEIAVIAFAWLWMLAAFIFLLMLVVTGLVFLLTPSIVATTEEDVLLAIFQTAGILWSQRWRLLFHLLQVAVAAILGWMVLAFGVKRAFLLMNALFAAIMGTDYQNPSTQAQHQLQSCSMAINNLMIAIAPGLKSQFFSHD
ncbi:MAG: hypothetical protein ONB42_13650 [candidate division KSB1 bacterium]|nr:hypothetical protein [candidate division KSB1 bacterium]